MEAKLIIHVGLDDRGNLIDPVEVDFDLKDGDAPVTVTLSPDGVTIKTPDEPKVVTI